MVDADVLAGPHGSVDTATDGVHLFPVRVRLPLGVEDPATHVCALTWGIDVAVGGLDLPAEVGVLNLTTRGGVQSHLVVALLVDALEDVDFAAHGPFARVAQ